MQHFIPIERIAEHRYALQVTEELCVGPVGHAFLFGGAGLGSAIRAAETSLDRNVVCTTMQFVSFARLGNRLDIDVAVGQAGRTIAQALVTGRVEGQIIFSAIAALGGRDDALDRQWPTMPVIPPPGASEVQSLAPPQDSKARLLERLEVRTATDAQDGTGRVRLWIRSKEDDVIDSAMLAVFADFIPAAVGVATTRIGGGNSLDNNLRIGKIVPTNWAMCDMQVQSTARGFAHGTMHIYAEDGTLIANASQSLVLKAAGVVGTSTPRGVGMS